MLGSGSTAAQNVSDPVVPPRASDMTSVPDLFIEHNVLLVHVYSRSTGITTDHMLHRDQKTSLELQNVLRSFMESKMRAALSRKV